MKRNILALALLALSLAPAPAHALTFVCANCSTNLVQMLDRVTNMEQLTSALKHYSEAVTQTAQQIEMVRQNVEQYANMLQNTAQLPANLVGELKSTFTSFAAVTNQLRTQRGDIVALGEIFTTLFPDQAFFGELAGASPEQVQSANAQYRQEWDKWGDNVEQATQATFQLSGYQLAEMQKNPQQFQNYLNDLLATPDGQMKAIQAGNQLSALQIQETRQLRELLATQTQSALASQMKSEKESQMQEELWRETSKTNRLGGLQSKQDPF